MTLDQLEVECDKAEAWVKQTGVMREAKIQLAIIRDCKGKRIKIAKGLYGEILQWGGKTSPTIFVLKVLDVRNYIAKMKEVAV
jgi:hypothetical protein